MQKKLILDSVILGFGVWDLGFPAFMAGWDLGFKKMGNRRKARELALQFLYQIEITREDPGGALAAFWAEHPVEDGVEQYASELIRGTLGRLGEIDPILSRYAQNWVLSRMAAVDRNVLRLAAYEMLFSKKAPPIVAIDEAVDIAKRYSTPESGAFVNGILDRIRKDEMKDATQ